MTADPSDIRARCLPLAAVGVALAMAACGVTAGSSVRIDQAENAPRPPERAGQVGPAASDQDTLLAIVAAVRADAARAARAADPSALAVSAVAATWATWADGALGCPQPGRLYTQAAVAGWRLEVRGPGIEAVYHASRRGQWLWCPTGAAQDPRGTGPAVR